MAKILFMKILWCVCSLGSRNFTKDATYMIDYKMRNYTTFHKLVTTNYQLPKNAKFYQIYAITRSIVFVTLKQIPQIVCWWTRHNLEEKIFQVLGEYYTCTIIQILRELSLGLGYIFHATHSHTDINLCYLHGMCTLEVSTLSADSTGLPEL